jgi:hypothetical protein
LPSSLTRVLSRALVSSTCLPVSVCGTVTGALARGFSGRIGRPVGLAVRPRFLPAQARAAERICLSCQTLTGNTNYQRSCGALLSASPHCSSRAPVVPEYQPASHRLPRFTRTRLRTDSTQEDEPSLRTLRLSADGILTRLRATYTGILTSASSTGPHGPASPYCGTLPYHRAADDLMT